MVFLTLLAGKKHLGLDPDQGRGQFQEFTRALELIRTYALDSRQELIRYTRYGDMEYVDVLLANQVEKQVQRPLEPIELDHEKIIAGDERAARTSQIHRRMNQFAVSIRINTGVRSS